MDVKQAYKNTVVGTVDSRMKLSKLGAIGVGRRRERRLGGDKGLVMPLIEGGEARSL